MWCNSVKNLADIYQYSSSKKTWTTCPKDYGLGCTFNISLDFNDRITRRKWKWGVLQRVSLKSSCLFVWTFLRQKEMLKLATKQASMSKFKLTL